MCGLSYGTAIAQTNSIPNGNCESWTSSTFEIPQNYVQSSNSEALSHNAPFNCVKTTDAHHGNYAVQLTTEISATHDTVFGYFMNTNPSGKGGPSSFTGGFPYSQKPSGMRGYYKSSIALPDSGIVAAFFYKLGVLIGQYGVYISGTHTSYTLFSITFNPALAQNPDTVIFIAASSNFNNKNNSRIGSMLKLDSVSFTGVTSQPALFNGDFETWQSTTIEKPDNWILSGGSNNSPTGGVFKTTDAVTSNYAIELKTYLGDNNGVPTARGGQISTGWYPNNCNSNCYEQGGYPYTKQIDTLVFSYKYAPMGSDNAQVNLTFKKNGSIITNGNQGINLAASTSYQYKEIPFNLGQVPDSVMLDIQSSLWNDTLLSYVGSDLKIDNIHFKSQALSLTGIEQINSNDNDVRIYPNPINTFAIIEINPQINLEGTELRIYDVFGRTIKKIAVTEHRMTFDRNDLPNGIYFYELKNNMMLKTGKIIVE